MTLLKPLLTLSNNLILVFIGILGIGFIIGFHELGHFLLGKLFKIKTPSFAVGFGPKIYQRKIGETNFSIGAIPLGGYVESDKESFESKPYWQKMFVFAGGISFNLIFAYIIFCILFMVGLPKTKFLYPINTTPIIEKVAQNENIANLNIKAGDKIIAINKKPLNNNSLTLFKELRSLKTKQITLKIKRNEQTQEIKTNPKALLEAFGKMQISFKFAEPKGLPFLESIKKGIKLTNTYILNTLMLFKNMFVKRDSSALGGPIMIISETAKGVSKGLTVFLLLLAIISVSLAVFNLIPLPILDGGQALLCTIEAITRIKISDKVKEIISIISLAIIMIIFVLISARDIWRIILSLVTKK